MQSAEAYEQEVVLQAKGNVSRYNALLKPYLAAPEVTHERLYLDTVQDVLSHTNNVIVDSGAHNVLYLPLDQMIKSHIAANGALPKGSTSPNVSISQSDIDKAKQQFETIMKQGNYGRPRPSYTTPTATASGGFRS